MLQPPHQVTKTWTYFFLGILETAMTVQMMEMRALMMILTKWLTVRMTRKTNCRRQQQECFHIKSLLLIHLKSSFPFLVAEFSGLNDDPMKNPFEVLFYHSTEQHVHLNLCRRNRSLYVHYFFSLLTLATEGGSHVHKSCIILGPLVDFVQHSAP